MLLAELLRKNAHLKNIHAGKRCFLIGNGPSLQHQDLKPLQNEITIVASSFFKHPDAALVNPAYWILADPDFFKQPEELLAPVLQPVFDKNLAPRLFVPTAALGLLSQINRGALLDLNFFHYSEEFVPERDLKNPIDFCNTIPPLAQNVMMVALMLAFHLGCNPIYMIGCDHDFYGITKETYQESKIPHFYPQNDQDRHVQIMAWEQWQECMQKMDQHYCALHQYAQLHGHTVCNATRGGCLETFPRQNYEELLQGQAGISTQDPLELQDLAVRLQIVGEHQGALVLLREAARNNLHRQNRANDVEYLMAQSLAALGDYRQARRYALEDRVLHPEQSERSMLLQATWPL